MSTSSRLAMLARLRVGAHVEADDHGAGGARQRDVAFVDAADRRRAARARATSSVDSLVQRCRRCASTEPCTSALIDDRQFLGLAGGDLGEHLLQRAALGGRHGRAGGCDRAAELADLAGAGFGFDHDELRRRPAACPAGPALRPAVDGPALSTVRAAIVEQRAHAAPLACRRRRCRRPCSVPRCTSRVATAPRPRSSLASITAPCAGAIRVGLQLQHFGLQQDALPRACRDWSSSWPRPRPPARRRPCSSTTSSCCSSSLPHALGLASGLSILLMATMIGTFAALAWRIASTVCGMMPSSAATTSTTMSVTLAPRARISVKAAWPGVSMKVILPPLAQRHLVGADMLGDAAGFVRRHIGLAQRIEQRGLAVVDMAHDGDDRRARLPDARRHRRPAFEAGLDVGRR